MTVVAKTTGGPKSKKHPSGTTTPRPTTPPTGKSGKGGGGNISWGECGERERVIIERTKSFGTHIKQSPLYAMIFYIMNMLLYCKVGFKLKIKHSFICMGTRKKVHFYGQIV